MQNKPMQAKTKKQLTMLLAALTLGAPLIGAHSPALQNTPLGIKTAEAQTYRRGRDYRDSDLQRLAWITRRGIVTNNPNSDYLEMRAEDGQNFRVVTRANVSLSNINRNDRIEVYGKRDGGIIIAYSVKEIGGSTGNWNNTERTLQGMVTSDNDNRRFSMRLNDGRNVNIVSDERTPIRLSRGDTVVVNGRWNSAGRWNNNSVFRADSVRITNNTNWQNERILQGVITSDNNHRRFSMRLNDGRNVNVAYDERVPRRLSRGDFVRVEGRWVLGQRGNASDNVFHATDVRIVSNTGNNNNGTRVDFRGEIIRATQSYNTWDYVVRSNGRDYLVRFNEKFRIGDRVHVMGVLRNGRVTASDIDRA